VSLTVDAIRTEDCETERAPVRRVISLDAFRGLAVLGMLLVNEKTFGPATPRQLTHAGWAGGVHLADMVFPWFLFIVGVAIPYAAVSRRGGAAKSHCYYLGVMRRTAILVLLGCLINSSYARHPVFDFGVLQLLGFAYLLAALLYELPRSARQGAAAALLIGYWALLRFLPAGAGAGLFTEARNAARFLNEMYLSKMQLEGALNVLPTAALALIGTTFGVVLRSALPPERKVRRVLVAGLALVALGWLWHYDLPFNKPLWTPSYVAFAAGGGPCCWPCCIMAWTFAGGSGGRCCWWSPAAMPSSPSSLRSW